MNGFTGDFCEFKTEQDTLLFFDDYNQFVFAVNGRLIQNYTAIDNAVSGFGSCSTMLNGEAVIFGGNSLISSDSVPNHSMSSVRQVINRQRIESRETNGYFVFAQQLLSQLLNA